MPEYYNVTTNLGDAEIANAIATNTKLNITHIAFGDGNGSVPTPSKSRTSLVREVHRQAVTKYERHATNANWIVIETIIPSDIGGFIIREMGIIANGKLISHGSHAPFEKVADPTGVSEYRLRFTQNVTDGSVVEITLDGSLIYASQAWVEENFIKRSEIIDNLTTNDATKPLSAKQGKDLQDNKLGKSENAASATKLQTARNVFGQNFDGSGDVGGTIIATTGLVGSNDNHFIDMGRGGSDRMNFYNYGAVFNFIDSLNGNVVARITQNGIDCNAASATDCSRSVIAGNGLSGGGELNANRTVTLGTPSKITGSTTNSVTATSHTHEIDNASISVAGVVKLNNTLTSTSTSEAATANTVKLLNDQAFGVGQTWNNVTASRVLGTTYTNTTEKTIFVSFQVRDHSDQSNQVVNIYVDAIKIIDSAAFDGGVVWGCFSHSFPVPPGGTYSIQRTGNGTWIWMEFK